MSASLRLQTRKSGEEPDFRIRRALVPWHRACAHAAPRCGASNRSKIERSPARDSGRGHPLRPERGTARDRASSAVVFGGRELGRASCRERVCQYVSIPVVAVSLKKKPHSPSIRPTHSAPPPHHIPNPPPPHPP